MIILEGLSNLGKVALGVGGLGALGALGLYQHNAEQSELRDTQNQLNAAVMQHGDNEAQRITQFGKQVRAVEPGNAVGEELQNTGLFMGAPIIGKVLSPAAKILGNGVRTATSNRIGIGWGGGQ